MTLPKMTWPMSVGLDAGPGHGGLRGDDAEVGGGEVLERAAEGAEAGADAGEERRPGSGAGRLIRRHSKRWIGRATFSREYARARGPLQAKRASGRSPGTAGLQITVPLMMTAFFGMITMPSRM